jgi:luciferase family oxidoreductase group 1
MPAIWLLGSSGYSAQLAGMLGLPFSFAHHFSAENTLPALDLYRKSFQPSGVLTEPYAMVAVMVICAESDEEARRLAASGRMTFTLLRRGQLIAVPPPEEALRFLAADDLTSEQPRSQRRAVLGAPETVREQLAEVVASYGAEEAIVVCITYEHEARRQSYELLAEVFELEGSGPGGGPGATDSSDAGMVPP